MDSQVTVQDVAEKAGVDVTDVAKVMFQQKGVDRLIRNRVLAAMDELHFDLRPKVESTGYITLGVIVAGLVNDYIDAVVSDISEATRAAQIGLKIYVPEDDFGEELPRFISDPQIFGVILLSPHYYAETLNTCRQYEVPIASFSYEDGVDLSEILLLGLDNHSSIMKAVDHLVGLGHQRIAIINGYMQHNDAIERYEGYLAGLDKHGIRCDENLICTGDFLEESGYEAGLCLLQRDPRPTAIVASSDMMAVGAMRAARSLGLFAGRDFSITGFDNVPLAARMGLTTLAPPYLKLAETAIQGLQQMAAGETLQNYEIRYEADFIVRRSTGACG